MNIKGLTEEQVIKNREKYGKNIITNKKQDGFLKLLISTLGDPIIKILLIALGIKMCFLIKNFDWFETVGIVIAIFLASFISSISEYGSEKAFEQLQKESAKINCKVIRNNQIQEIDIEKVVVGDIISLQQGDKIPADGNIIEGKINVDESSLNGETKEIEKNIRSKIYRGTTVYSGEALMQVKEVGDKTYYGKLALEIQEKQPESPLKQRLRVLAKTISNLGYLGALLVTISYLFSVIVLKNHFNIQLITKTITNIPLMFGHILYALTLSVTIIIVAVPEGLPMMITLVLSSNMKKMIKDNIMVRKLVGIETAGNLNILFTDKTGTLTKGKLEVIGFVSSNLKTYKQESDLLKYKKLHELVLKSCYYNNSSRYDNNKIIGGNITDRALLEFIKTKPKNLKKIMTLPFDSKNKYMMTKIDDLNKTTLIKGAYEKIMPHCTKYIDEFGEIKYLKNKYKIKSEIEKYTKKGIRVLTLATSNQPELKNLTLVGFILIKDEIRKEAIKGLELVKKAHIKTVMITGDNKQTAISIGKEVGLLDGENDIIMTSDELNQKTDEELKKIIPNLKIVARSLPQDKSKLVRLSQELGLVVGMTGDGVNDAPALKKADVGFAMGSGTEVSKEASDIVILDDNFLSISKAILFGRTIFKSIRKFIIFQLTVNICAVSLSIIGPFIGIETPVTVIQMLWINMVMDTLAGLAFSFEPPLEEYMEEYPKKKDEKIINKYMRDEILFTGIYSSILCILFLKLPIIVNMFRNSSGKEYLLSAFFGLFIFMGIFNSFNARTHRLNLLAHLYKNKIFMIIIGFIIIVQIILIYYGGNIFRTVDLNIKEFIVMLLLSMTVIPVDFLRKIYLRYKGNIGGV